MSWGGAYTPKRRDDLASETKDLVKTLGANLSRRQVEETMEALKKAKRGEVVSASVARRPMVTRTLPFHRADVTKLTRRKKVNPSDLEREQFHGQGDKGKVRVYLNLQ